ncbi:hypothetical protein H2201_008915 [Coniosporium apollinis]|uniref:Aldehyde dehydrogenase domain-containing protein n=1 Tax=Coniosporium apollinis TaxID=61459 RepID=A0ABQ9NFX9_9PEZI|nr:hypothetical protein H2201_008915 [Coniosporium apollinis]
MLELADFFRFNVAYAQEIYNKQPTLHAQGNFGRIEWRPLEGFVYAISPFNFTAIGGNLVSAPAVIGNVVILLEAGLPPDVIQFVTSNAELITRTVYDHKGFAALHFTGLSDVFKHLYGKAAEGVVKGKYRDFPRIVSKTSGKNFHLVHKSADIGNAIKHTIRAAFEYSGQKYSACSRIYIPESKAERFLSKIKKELEQVKVGYREDFRNFLGPVIQGDEKLERVIGGTYSGSEGCFIDPSVYITKDINHHLSNQEIFSPVLLAYVYRDKEFEQLLSTINK